MEKMNYEENLSKLAMEKAKKAAQHLNENWRGLGDVKASVNTGSYTEGIKQAVLNESSNTIEPAKKGFYSLGLEKTLLALRNTPLYELPVAKIMVERYLNNLMVKGHPEVYLFESLLKELSNFSWEENAKKAITNLTKIYEGNVKEILVMKTAADLKNSGGRELFSGLGETLNEWLSSPTRSADTLIGQLNKWSFSAPIKNLINNISLLENKSSSRLSIKSQNANSEVKKIIAPSMLLENASVHAINGRFIKISGNKLSIMEKADVAKLPGRFLNAVLALSGKDVRINENGVDFLNKDSKVSVVFEGAEKKILVNGRQVYEKALGSTLSIEFKNYFGNSAPIVERVMSIIKYSDDLAELDFAKSIKSKVYEGVEVNLFKLDKTIYVQRVNPAMSKNEMFESNGNQAVNLVKEFIGFDISESLTEFLDGENKVKSIMYNDKKIIADNMKLIENELAKIENAVKTNPLVADSKEILEAKELLEDESDQLKTRWNQINVEIERFERGSKKVSINETGGYGLETSVKVKRTGVKGVIIGINPNSKTYTIMTEKGSTGEYFFGDVTNVIDEIKTVDINGLKEGKEIDDLSTMNLAGLPGGKVNKTVNKPSMTSLGSFGSDKTSGGQKIGGAKGPKDIDNEANMNLATLKFKQASGHTEGPTGTTGKSDLSNALKFKGAAGNKDPKGTLGDTNMSKAPGSNAKNAAKDIDKETSMALGKLPKGVNKKGVKDIDNEKSMNLGTLKGTTKKVVNKPSGTSAGAIKSGKITEGKEQKNDTYAVAPGKSAKNGKKFIEKASDSNMAKIPGSTNHNGKKFHNNLKDSNLAKMPGLKGKTKGGSLKMLNGKVKKSK